MQRPVGRFVDGDRRRAPAAAANDTSNDLTPIFECAFKVPNSSTYQTVWGYDNETGAVKTFNVGDQNRFVPVPNDRGQPTTFATGRHDNVLVVPWNGNDTLRYHLDNGTVNAALTPACANNPVPITGSGLSSVVAVFVLALGAVGLDQFIRRRRKRVDRSAS